MRAGFAAAQQQYAAIVARDSGDAEAWYGLGDAHWHDQGDGAHTAKNWTRALRAFNRTLALDSSFHLAYQHKLNTYQTAGFAQSWYVLDGDSVRALSTDTDLQTPATAEAKRRAQQLAIREARGWVAADPVSQAYMSLASSLLTARQFDSAAAVLTEAVARPELRRGTLPFVRAAILTRVDPARAFAATREALRAADAQAIAAEGGSNRAWEIFGAANAAAYGGSVRDLEALSRLAAAAQPTFPGSTLSTASAMRWFETAAKLAMGVPPASVRATVDSAITGFERMTEPFAPQMRQQSAPVLYTAYLATRDQKYAGAYRRWRGATTPLPELDALEALARADTAAAQQAARLFPSPDSMRAAGGAGMNATRWVARAEALTALGDARRALAMYEVLDPARFESNTPVDAGLPLYARSFLARGRLYEELGERAKAAQAYERFLTLWKDADPQFQGQLREARAGLARVKDAGGQGVRAG